MMPTHHPDTHPTPEQPSSEQSAPEQSRGRRAARAAQPYGRADAFADGLLIEVPTRLSRQFNFRYPLAITAAAWCDAVQWTGATERGKATGSGQNEASRLTEVLWAARLALYTNRTGTQHLDFLVHRVPVYGPDTRPLRLTLRVSVHPGDCGETVVTIGHAHQPVAGTFVLPDADRAPAGQPVLGWPAAALEHDRSGQVHPVVTPDILDRILAVATDPTSTSGIEVSTGNDGEIYVHHAGGITVTLRPDPSGRYSLRPLDWPFQFTHQHTTTGTTR